MHEEIINHKAWKQSSTGYYSKYIARVVLSGFSFWDYGGNIERLPIDRNFDGEYKKVRKLDRDGLFEFRVYTSNVDLLLWFAKAPELQDHIEEITCPANQSQIDELQKFKDNVLYREKYFFGKYKFRLQPDNYWTYQRQNMSKPSNEIVLEAINFLKDNFKDSRIQYTNGRYSMMYTRSQFLQTGTISSSTSLTAQRMLNIPTLYTNDEGSLMLYKLKFGADLLFNIDKVTLLSNV